MDAEERYREALEKFHAEREKRAAEQAEARRKAEIEALDSAADMREYMARRKELQNRVFSPDTPLDSTSMSEYLKRRPRGKR
jgi:hypothetical protein